MTPTIRTSGHTAKSSTRCKLWEPDCPHHSLHLWNSQDLPARDIDHLVHEQLGIFYGQQNSLDHDKQPLCHNRDVDDLEENTLCNSF